MLTHPIADQDILSAAKQLPAAPQVLARLHGMLVDVNSGLSQIANLIRRDAALAARILSIANSPAYGGAGSIGSIEDALQRVGFGEVFRLVGVVTNRSFSSQLGCYGWSASDIASHNLFSALVAESLAKRMKMDPRIAYTAGLLRTIGMVLLDRLGKGCFAPSETFVQAGGGDLPGWEERTFGIEHDRINAILYRSWGFPDEMAEASENRDLPLARLLALTVGIVRGAGFGLPEDRGVQGATAEDLQAAGLSMDDARDVLEAAKAGFRSLGTL